MVPNLSSVKHGFQTRTGSGSFTIGIEPMQYGETLKFQDPKNFVGRYFIVVVF